MSIAVRFGNAYSVMNKLFHHPVQKFVGYGLGVLAVFGAFIFVQAQIAPGTVKSPVFIPPTDVSLSGIACNWSGTQKKQVGCDVGSDQDGCLGINVTCTNGRITRFGQGIYVATNGGVVDCVAYCGTPW